jgi:hypothetical protein
MNAHMFAAVVLALSLFAWVPTADAAPRPCPTDAVQAWDMSGVYESQYMLLVVDGCGTAHLSWLNQFGEHRSSYAVVDTLPRGGYIAYGYAPDPGLGLFLDNMPVLVIKPAERGYIQIASVESDVRTVYQVYRLRKTMP